jgi:hypothetical protein
LVLWLPFGPPTSPRELAMYDVLLDTEQLLFAKRATTHNQATRPSSQNCHVPPCMDNCLQRIPCRFRARGTEEAHAGMDDGEAAHKSRLACVGGQVTGLSRSISTLGHPRPEQSRPGRYSQSGLASKFSRHRSFLNSAPLLAIQLDFFAPDFSFFEVQVCDAALKCEGLTRYINKRNQLLPVRESNRPAKAESLPKLRQRG